MAKTQLLSDPKKRAEMLKMFKDSIPPGDVADHFGISVPTVHKYKERFKAEGKTFPSVRGKRPQNKSGKQVTVTDLQAQPQSRLRDMITPKPSAAMMEFQVGDIAVKISPSGKLFQVIWKENQQPKLVMANNYLTMEF